MRLPDGAFLRRYAFANIICDLKMASGACVLPNGGLSACCIATFFAISPFVYGAFCCACHKPILATRSKKGRTYIFNFERKELFNAKKI